MTIASHNNGTGATGQIQFAGTNPGFTDAGPGQAIIGTLVSGSGYGLFLNGSGGSPTTFNGSGNGLVNIGSSTAGINGSGGLVFAGTGLGYFNLLGGNSAAPNDFTGGVTVDSGTLEISSSLALASNTLTINGGSVQSLTTLSLPNPVVANTTVTVNVGTFNLSGGISGPGGLHLLNGSGTGGAAILSGISPRRISKNLTCAPGPVAAC